MYNMKYLLYYLNGFIKKYPLNKKTFTIGRSSENDLTVEDEYLSRKHLNVKVEEDHIMIKDRDSLNGTYVNQKKISEVKIKIGESFILGGLEFFLKTGKIDEFKPAKELIPIFNNLNHDNKQRFRDEETKYIKDIYNETLKHILKTGLSKNNFSDFIMELSKFIFNIVEFGNLFLVTPKDKDLNILFSVKKDPDAVESLKKIVEVQPHLFEKSLPYQSLSESLIYFATFHLKIKGKDAALVYSEKNGKGQLDAKIEKFLTTLAEEVALFSQFLSDGTAKSEAPDIQVEGESEFLVANKRMKEIISQAKKIAQSDMFVLIQGESGTGKELLAKLIHKYSKRSGNKLIGINCAAIPETLLESELFGYEKGAFTGAYQKKRGKLELASGSSLILDEIGDMPLNLQSKLLRALQENEFYRLGGTSPVKVDLRVISTTNKNLKKLINENKFREDLYFRLVHRTISIPPLRERKEDISLLINYFTNMFCQEIAKNISGYSVKAFEVLLNYPWRGNVRQLKNEVNSIVNLTDDGEMITFDILSDEIKYNVDDYTKTSEFYSPVNPEESEKEMIIRLLKKNNWNKSKTARELKMTYQGLHKKMNRLGIKKERDAEES